MLELTLSEEAAVQRHTTSMTASFDSLSSCLNIGGQIGNVVFSETAQPLECFWAVRTGNLGKEFKSSFSNLGQVYKEYSRRSSGYAPEAQDGAASELDSAPLFPALQHFYV